ncbi:carbohydrate ABC transporter permease [Halanaerobiaceae bacterium Z-7014]|uniref:Carbohydrate ABC transporter permease n=1 Tax=Halonatronomonas betaini TaxID=2778430 RepID=A0A931APU0_9FIRM|nr:carbohydrate ABC transporter permease [Halonatronomonas betaini]MBF8436262.1 carbohydrate ABC transporter permease [Halonatronomonas betaini]
MNYSNKLESNTQRKAINIIKKVLLYSFLAAGVIITFVPFLYMFLLATRSRAEIFSSIFSLAPGQSFMDNYQILISNVPIWRNLFNSIFISTTATILTVFFCSLGGYGFSKYNFKFKDTLFFSMLATMMIPGLLSIIPWFIMMNFFGWIDTFYPMIIPGIANPFGIFLMTQFMNSIPYDVIDAARIDGCGEFEIFLKIILPMSKSGIGALSVLTFLGSWNVLMQPLLILQSRHMWTLPVALTRLADQAGIDHGAAMVGVIIAIAPILIAYIIGSKSILKGVMEGATKG